MQYLILSDIHANWQALEAVLADCKDEYDQIVCCGDIVGYNPNPSEVVNWVQANCPVSVRGNHDKVVAGLDDLEWFSDLARDAAVWTRRVLSEGQMVFLRGMRAGPVACDHFHLWHGSPADEDEYISVPEEAAPRFSYFDFPLAFFGHTHIQGGFFSRFGRVGRIPQVGKRQREGILYLEPDTLYMVNPGAVGQPRDRDPRAAYALYNPDTRAVTLRRTPYAVERTADAIKAAHLPPLLAARLFSGF